MKRVTSKGHRGDSPLPPGLSQGPSRLVAPGMSTLKLDRPPRRVSLKDNSRQDRMVEGRPGNLWPRGQEPAPTPAAAEPEALCRAARGSGPARLGDGTRPPLRADRQEAAARLPLRARARGR